ncbi:tryptophan synthase beta chain 1-like [Iris pallida]|uniref:tryptophan synthase n=1 Tax=Iris pallida TaxID=29817 RepID=A0AAX6EMT8_IRIPA|nr:tryptophan synthase beta chain 1-like [Iris pallida]
MAISTSFAAIQGRPPVRPSPLRNPPLPLRHEKLDLSKEVITRQFGHFGGMFVPETLIHDLRKLESAFRSFYPQETFQRELKSILRDYVGRESPLYFAERLTDHYKHSNDGGGGPQIFLKREDLNHTGAHTINNAVAQALLAARLGKRRIVADTGSGLHGLSVAAVCAKLGLQCVVYMGAKDMEKHGDEVLTMHLMGAEVRAVHSDDTLSTDAESEAMRDAVTNLDSTYHIVGSAIGPHPYPTMVREFQSVIGRETRRQAMEKWGGKPDVLVACVGRGSNAIGLFHEFFGDADVRLVGVEAAGRGLDSGRHAASLATGEVGVYRGAMSHVLQDHDGQIVKPDSVSAGYVSSTC